MQTKNDFLVAFAGAGLGLLALGGVVAAATVPNPLKAVTSLLPAITVSAQKTVANTVAVKRVVIPEDGWLVIHQSADGQPGAVLGKTPLKKGTATNVKVKISDPKKITPTLVAMLHRDLGKKKIYEFPGKDVPLEYKKKIVMQGFMVLNAPGGGD